jgi:hypothetical protein
VCLADDECWRFFLLPVCALPILFNSAKLDVEKKSIILFSSALERFYVRVFTQLGSAQFSLQSRHGLNGQMIETSTLVAIRPLIESETAPSCNLISCSRLTKRNFFTKSFSQFYISHSNHTQIKRCTSYGKWFFGFFPLCAIKSEPKREKVEWFCTEKLNGIYPCFVLWSLLLCMAHDDRKTRHQNALLSSSHPTRRDAVT